MNNERAPLGSSYQFGVQLHHPDTLLPSESDETPTYRVYENGTYMAGRDGVLVAADDDDREGLYVSSMDLESDDGFELGNSYAISVEAQVDGYHQYHLIPFKIDDDVSSRASQASQHTIDQIATGVVSKDISAIETANTVAKILKDAKADATTAKDRLNANFVQFVSANPGNKTIENLTTPKNLTITVDQ